MNFMEIEIVSLYLNKFRKNLAANLDRSPLIHSYCYASAGDSSTLFAIFSLSFVPFMQYVGWLCWTKKTPCLNGVNTQDKSMGVRGPLLSRRQVIYETWVSNLNIGDQTQARCWPVSLLMTGLITPDIGIKPCLANFLSPFPDI